MKLLSERDENFLATSTAIFLTIAVGMKLLSERDENFMFLLESAITEVSGRNEATL